MQRCKENYTNQGLQKFVNAHVINSLYNAQEYTSVMLGVFFYSDIQLNCKGLGFLTKICRDFSPLPLLTDSIVSSAPSPASSLAWRERQPEGLELQQSIVGHVFPITNSPTAFYVDKTTKSSMLWGKRTKDSILSA